MSALRNMMGDPWFVAAVGLLLAVLALAGTGYSAAAAVAQHGYWAAKYGTPSSDPERVADLCRKAYAWYPHNYYFSILACETAYYASGGASGEIRKRRLDQAALWCDRGLRQNRFKSQLRNLKARLLWLESPSKAIRYWAAYTDWHFWSPHNHAELAEMYAKVGDWNGAERELKWIEGMSEGLRAREAVERERREWNAVLNGEDARGR